MIKYIEKIKKFVLKKWYRYHTLKGQFIIWRKESKEQLKEEMKEAVVIFKKWLKKKLQKRKKKKRKRKKKKRKNNEWHKL